MLVTLSIYIYIHIYTYTHITLIVNSLGVYLKISYILIAALGSRLRAAGLDKARGDVAVLGSPDAALGSRYMYVRMYVYI